MPKRSARRAWPAAGYCRVAASASVRVHGVRGQSFGELALPLGDTQSSVKEGGSRNTLLLRLYCAPRAASVKAGGASAAFGTRDLTVPRLEATTNAVLWAAAPPAREAQAGVHERVRKVLDRAHFKEILLRVPRSAFRKGRVGRSTLPGQREEVRVVSRSGGAFL